MKWSEAGIFEKIFFKDLATDEEKQDINIDSICIQAYKAITGVRNTNSDSPKPNQKSMTNEML